MEYKLQEEDTKLRDDENSARALYISHRTEAIAQGPFWKLVNVYDELDSFRTPSSPSPYESLFSHYSEFGWSRGKYPENENPDLRIECDKSDFLENFNFLTGGLFTHVNWDNVFVAGGAVLACLQRRPKFLKDVQNSENQEHLYRNEMKYWHRYNNGTHDGGEGLENDLRIGLKMTTDEKKQARKNKGPKPKLNTERGPGKKNSLHFQKGRSRFGESDIDIFLYDLTPAEATRKLIDLTEQFRRAGAEPSLNPYREGAYENAPEILAVRTENAITYITTPMHPHLQIILRIYGAPAEILMGFDIDSCCVGFDGTNAWALPRARRAIKYSANVADPARESRTYEIRYKRSFLNCV